MASFYNGSLVFLIVLCFVKEITVLKLECFSLQSEASLSLYHYLPNKDIETFINYKSSDFSLGLSCLN